MDLTVRGDVEHQAKRHVDLLAGTIDGLREHAGVLARWGSVLAER